MYVYINSESNLWTVGFYSPNGKWNPESDHRSQESAAERVHYLNGGTLPKLEKVIEGLKAEEVGYKKGRI